MQQQVPIHSDRERVELFFSARALANLDVISDSDPQCLIYYKEGQKGVENLLGKTEIKINSLNPDWKNSVVLDFIFEVNQYLRFVVIDNDGNEKDNNEVIGILNATLGQIMGSRNQIYIGELFNKNKKTGKLLIRADKRKTVEGLNEFIYWQWYGTKIKNMDGWFGISDPFLRFYKWHMQIDWLMIYETEFKQDNENPVWGGFEITYEKLNDSNPKQPFKIELWDNEKNGKHQFIGAIEVTMEQIILQEIRSFQIKTPKGEQGGIIGIKSMIKPTFIDYLKGGEQINLSIAIDFTGSNGNPKFDDSLHYNCPEQLNQYQDALKQVSEILLCYDFDKKVSVYGFGGTPQLANYKKTSVDHCFPLNGNKNDPEVLGLEGIMNVYRNALPNIILDCPTYFSQIIQNSIKIAEKNKSNNIYTVVLILTDGLINDMEETLGLIKKCFSLPLSFIVVGIGSADFSMMQQLDDINYQKQNRERNLVQFVPFKQHQQIPGELARVLLARLPKQLVEYKLIVGKDPNLAKDINLTVYYKIYKGANIYLLYYFWNNGNSQERKEIYQLRGILEILGHPRDHLSNINSDHLLIINKSHMFQYYKDII